jgi:hypothetical protein
MRIYLHQRRLIKDGEILIVEELGATVRGPSVAAYYA